MRKLNIVVLVIVISLFNNICFAEIDNSLGGIKTIIPVSSDYSFNRRWVNPKIAGDRFWYCVSPNYCRLYDMDRYGWMTYPIDTIAITMALHEHKNSISDDQAANYKFRLFKAKKVPLMVHGGSPSGWDAEKQVMVYNNIPDKAEREILEAMPNFMGWQSFGEWGNRLYNWIGKDKKPPSHARAAKKVIVPESPRTPQEFSAMAAKFWEVYNKPLDYQVDGHDGTFYWAMQWPAILGARSIINETRYVGRNAAGFQYFTRAAGRMGNLPWGFAPGATFDVRWAQGPQRSDIGPRSTEQLSRGYATYPHNLMRRLMYFWCMGSADIIADEATYRSIDDPEQDGTYRFTPYGYIIDEVVKFSRHYRDRGMPYTPIGILLSWDNAFVSPKYKTSGKAYNMFKYNIGEQMTMQLFDEVLNPIPEGSAWNSPMVHFGAMPYGDIFDPLRIDTPKGPLAMDLLKNYKVLFAVGKQNIAQALSARMKEYVQQGGTLVLNVKQLKGDLLNNDFIGVELDSQPAKANKMICVFDGKELNSGEFSYTPLTVDEKSIILYKASNGDALVTRHPYGKGYIIITGAHWLLEDETEKILPLADDMISRLTKLVLPFEVSGDHLADRVLYQVNRKGKGWVISLFNNAGVKYNNTSPVKIWPSYKVDVKIKVPKEVTDAVEWLSHNRLEIESGVITVPVAPGEVRIVEFQPQDIPPVKVEEHINLAINSKATASSYCAKKYRNKCDSNPYANRVSGDNTPEKAINGNGDIFDAWWSKTHADYKADTDPWLQLDLGDVKDIRSINPIYMWSEDNDTLSRVYQYYIEISKDGENWKTVIDERKNSSLARREGVHCYFVEAPLKARYVRIVTTLATAHGGAQIVEFEVYGTNKISKTYQWK